MNDALYEETPFDALRRQWEMRLRIEEEWRRRVRSSLPRFGQEVAPHFIWYRMHLLLAHELELVRTGDTENLLICTPPRHGKSEEVKLFAARALCIDPNLQIGLGSYSADLAVEHSRGAQDYFLRGGGQLHPEFTSAKDWHVKSGRGGLWAAGVGGTITGRGYDIGIIDDPVKNAEEAFSTAIQESTIEWWKSTWITRGSPGARKILILTRWANRDLAGWLIANEAELGNKWRAVIFEAIKTDEPWDFHPNITIVPDWRKPGEVLTPERYDYNILMSLKRNSSFFWSPLYQQRPVEKEGRIWKAEWFQTYDKLPKGVTDEGIDWDTAYTKDEENAATAYVRSCRKGDKMYVIDIGWDHKEFPAMLEWMKTFKVPPYVEAKASGKSAVQVLKSANLPAKEVKVPSLDKVARTKLASPFAEQGRIFIQKDLLERMLRDPKQGILAFPAGKADLNDVFVQAIFRHFGTFKPITIKSIQSRGDEETTDDGKEFNWRPL